MSRQKKNQPSVRQSISGIRVKPHRHKPYPLEFREKAVKMITELGYTTSEVAQQLDCSVSAVLRWKSEMTPLDPETSARMELGEDENKRLRKENARLKMENEILKKATAYFARDTM